MHGRAEGRAEASPGPSPTLGKDSLERETTKKVILHYFDLLRSYHLHKLNEDEGRQQTRVGASDAERFFMLLMLRDPLMWNVCGVGSPVARDIFDYAV